MVVRISPEGFGSIAMLFNFLISITVSKFTKKVPEEVQKLVLEIKGIINNKHFIFEIIIN